jgi:hypothetical protein
VTRATVRQPGPGAWLWFLVIALAYVAVAR